MAKMLTLLIIFLSMLGSMASYQILTEKITAGNLKIAAGQEQIAQGEQLLANGKAKLANGQKRLSRAKKSNKKLKSLQVVAATALPVSWVAASVVGGSVVDKKIAEGSKQIAIGKKKVKAGEQQLEAGKLELQKGIERLGKANAIRIACWIASIFFAALFIVLFFCWRRTVLKLKLKTL